MIRTTTELDELLRDTPLAGRETATVDIPRHDEVALAVNLAGVDPEQAWRTCRDRLDATGRWPAVMTTWSGAGGAWSSGLVDLFLRHPFEYEVEARGDVSPGALVAAAATAAVDAALERHAERSLFHRSLEEAVDEEVGLVVERLGRGPDASAVQALRASGEIATCGDLERWLLAWEAREVGEDGEASYDGYLQSGFEVGAYVPLVLVLLPTPRGWESLAYHHFYGAESLGSDVAIALLRRWHERWGAELVGHLGTMLLVDVARPPATLAEALPLAWEQATFAPCTTILPGIPTFHHARVLVGRPRWFLHERP